MKHKHTESFHTLDDVPDFKLSVITKLFVKMSKIMQMRHPQSQKNIRFRNLAIISALYITGGRASEVSEIKLKDVTFENGWIFIRLINRKNKRFTRKEIMANLEIEKVFLKWLVDYYNYRVSYCDLEDPLFPMIYQKQEQQVCITPMAIYHIATRYVKINPHFFRKLRASHLLEYYGFDVKALQQYLGWSSVLSSEPYLRISKSGIKQNYLKNQEEVKKIIGDGERC